MEIMSEHDFEVSVCDMVTCWCCWCRLPLEGMKRKVLRNLRLLESDNLVSSSDDYQDIINAIAKVLLKSTRLHFKEFFHTGHS